MANWESTVLDKFGLNSLHPFQRNALHQALQGTDTTLVCQRSGRGKSLCYQAFTTAYRVEKTQECVVLVVSPANAGMDEQCDMLNRLGISAVIAGRDVQKDALARQCSFQYVFFPPEVLLEKTVWRKALMSDIFHQKVKLLAIDEAHLIARW